MMDLSNAFVRPANELDLNPIKKLIHFSPNVHQHLDWFEPTDWIGNPPFLIVEQNDQIIAVLACPVIQQEIAWIRLFAVKNRSYIQDLWTILWHEVYAILAPLKASVAAISIQPWFQEILTKNGFITETVVVTLQWDGTDIPQVPRNNDIKIRTMCRNDLSVVTDIDNTAFDMMWRNSRASIEKALDLSAYATVAEGSKGIVGYQISTANTAGGHLARLAVLPSIQRHGIGFALVQDLLSQFNRWGAIRVTVNTQRDNFSSLSIYNKAGFQLKKETYPVYHVSLGKINLVSI